MAEGTRVHDNLCRAGNTSFLGCFTFPDEVCSDSCMKYSAACLQINTVEVLPKSPLARGLYKLLALVQGVAVLYGRGEYVFEPKRQEATEN